MILRALFPVSILLLLIACSKSKDPAPVNQLSSCFNVQTGTLTAQQNIQFTSCSNLAVSWLWDFGDGAGSTSESPVHVYSQAGTYTVKLTTSNGTKTQLSSKQITITKALTFLHPANTISHDSVWVTGIHLVTGTIKVNGAKLTIQPGAIVRFADGADKRIEVGSAGFGSSTLIANGTSVAPIQFTANSLNAVNSIWGAISIGPNTTSASGISYATIQYGGATYDNTRINAPLEFMDGGTIAVTNTAISKSTKYGIYLSQLSSFSTFTNNTVDLATQQGYPVCIDGDKLSSFIESTNTIKGRGIIITNTTITSSVSFSPYSLPFYTEKNLLLGDVVMNTVTINAGCTFNFAYGGSIMGRGTGYFTKFVATGTATNPVVLQSADTLNPWSGIRLTGEFDATSYMDYVKIKSALNTTVNEGVILVNGGAKLNLTNSYVGGEGVLIYLDKTAKLGSFTKNILDKIPFVYNSSYYSTMYITGNQFNNFPTGNTFLHLNYPNTGIWVDAYNISTSCFNITSDFNITNAGAPYFMSDWVTVGNSSSPSAGPTLTIQPGADIRFSGGAGLKIGIDDYSSLTAGLDAKLIMNGTATSPIHLGYEMFPGSSNYWQGLFLLQGTNPATSINYSVINGSETYDLYIDIRNGTSATPYPVIQNSTFSNAWSYPIFVDTNSKPDIKGTNTYTGNGTNSVFYY